MSYDKLLNKYLVKHSLNQFYKQNQTVKKKSYKYFVVIPVFNEHNFIFDTLESINNNSETYLENLLVVLIINNCINDSQAIKDNNYNTYQLLKEKTYKYECLVIDCFSPKYQLKSKYSGVGFARKIGMDFVLKYSNSDSIIFSLDADTIIDKNYFNIISKAFKKFDFKVCTINFQHQKSDDVIIEKAIRIYEKKLKEIALKINNTGSIYGYVSMGSAIALRTIAYIKVGGMAKKKATEDFYFLQSLAKYTKVHQINDILIYPSSRSEQRVYLGTGYRIKEYIDNKKFNNLDYSDNSYKNLELLLKLVEKSYNNEYFELIKNLEKNCDKSVVDFLDSNNFQDIWIKFCREANNKKQFLVFFNQWFDALKTIKFLKKLSCTKKI